MADKFGLEKEEPLWKDRKRILGMPISFTRYEATDDRLTVRRGLLNTTTEEILIYRVMDIGMSRSLGQKLFGVGTVTLMGSDISHPVLELKNIRNADDVRRFLSKLIETQREKKGIARSEFLAARRSRESLDGDLDGDGIPDDQENPGDGEDM